MAATVTGLVETTEDLLKKIKAKYEAKLAERQGIEAKLVGEVTNLDTRRTEFYTSLTKQLGALATERQDSRRKLQRAIADVEALQDQRSEFLDLEHELVDVRRQVEEIRNQLQKLKQGVRGIPKAEEINKALGDLDELVQDNARGQGYLAVVKTALVNCSATEEVERLKAQLLACHSAAVLATTGGAGTVRRAVGPPAIRFGDLKFVGRVRTKAPGERWLTYTKSLFPLFVTDPKTQTKVTAEKYQLAVETGLDQNPSVSFFFDQLFDDADEAVRLTETEKQNRFTSAIRDMIMPVVERKKNFIFITYGVSGTGKSYSLLGEPERGVGGAVFVLANALFERHPTIGVTFEQIHMAAKGGGGVREPIGRPATANSKNFSGLLNRAIAARETARTPMNLKSSRSHFIMKMVLEDGTTLLIVDMAGAEKLEYKDLADLYSRDTEGLKKRVDESTWINRSIRQLAEFYTFYGLSAQAASTPTRTVSQKKTPSATAPVETKSEKKRATPSGGGFQLSCSSKSARGQHTAMANNEWAFLTDVLGEFGHVKAETMFLQTLSLAVSMAPRLVAQQIFNHNLASLVFCPPPL